jgi:hypothetical protein
MNVIKQDSPTRLTLNDVNYRGYTVCDLPKGFGYKFDVETDTYGISKWFNYKGLTWVVV